MPAEIRGAPPLPLDERDWVFSSKSRSAWNAALAARNLRLLSGLEGLYGLLSGGFPDALARSGLGGSLRRFLDHPSREKDLVVSHPAFHHWLRKAGALIEERGDTRAELLPHLLHFHGFSAALALKAGEPCSFEARCDREGHVHLHGLAAYLDLGPRSAGEWVGVRIMKEKLILERAGRPRREIGTRRLLERPGERAPGVNAFPKDARDGLPNAAAPGLGIGRLPLITETLELNACDPLILAAFEEGSGEYDHKVARLDEKEREGFVSVMREAMARIRGFDPFLYGELSSDIRVLVPLANPQGLTSVSSTYSSLRGAIGLSHSDDVLVQGETLIHEFSHDKLNMLLELDPLLDERAPREPVFYSPWRKDPRPLRGVLIGAHAFLNTARFALAVGPELKWERERRRRAMVEASGTLLKVESALRTLGRHGLFTPFGRRFLLAMAAGLASLKVRAEAFPAEAREEALRAVLEHRRRHDPAFGSAAAVFGKPSPASLGRALTPGAAPRRAPSSASSGKASTPGAAERPEMRALG